MRAMESFFVAILTSLITLELIAAIKENVAFLNTKNTLPDFMLFISVFVPIYIVLITVAKKTRAIKKHSNQ